MNRHEKEHAAKRGREQARTSVLKGKGYNAAPKPGFSGGATAASVPANSRSASTNGRAEEKQMKTQQTPRSTAQSVGYAMRGARKALGIKR